MRERWSPASGGISRPARCAEAGRARRLRRQFGDGARQATCPGHRRTETESAGAGAGHRGPPGRPRRTARRKAPDRRAGIPQPPARGRCLAQGAARRLGGARTVRPQRCRRRPADHGGVRQRQSHRTHARRPRPRGGDRRRRRQSPRMGGIRGVSRVLHQRRRRPGVAARPRGPRARHRAASRRPARSARSRGLPGGVRQGDSPGLAGVGGRSFASVRRDP